MPRKEGANRSYLAAIDNLYWLGTLPRIMEPITPKDIRGFDRMLKQGWEMPAGITKALPAALADIIFSSEDVPGQPGKKRYKNHTRNRLSAARVLATLQQQNISLDPPTQQVHVTMPTDVTEAMAKLATVPREQLEQLAAARDIIQQLTPPTSSEPTA